MFLTLGTKMTEPKNEKEFLANYNIHDFNVPLTTVDMAIFTIKEGDLKVLLVKRAQYPSKGKWALPGGFVDVNADLDLDATASRKLKEKTGVNISHLEQVMTFGGKKRDPRGWSMTVAYMALIASENISLEVDPSSDEVVWVSVAEVQESYKLAFDHLTILDACHERLRSKVQYTSLPVNLLPESFTLTDLQKTFEIVLGSSVEKKSFRRRILDAEILEETGEMKTGSNRPAKLYRAKDVGKDHLFPRNLEGQR